METLFDAQEYDKKHQIEQQFNTLIKNWGIDINDCWEGAEDYFWILKGEMIIDFDDIIYINENNIQFKLYQEYFDYIMLGKNGNKFMNFEYWHTKIYNYETI